MPVHHRIIHCLLALIMALVLTWSGPVWAQSKEMIATYDQYKELNGQGKYAEVIPFAKRFIELVAQIYGDTPRHYAFGLGNLGRMLRSGY